MFLNKIKLENFKQHSNSVLPLKKINILIGPNGAGKSSILQSLLILKKTLHGNQGSLVLQDESYNFGKYEDVTRFGKLDEPLTIEIDGIQELSHGLGSSRATESKFMYKVTLKNHRIDDLQLNVRIGDYDLGFQHNSGKPHNYFVNTAKGRSMKLERPERNDFHPRFSLIQYESLNDEEKYAYDMQTIAEVNNFRDRFHTIFANGEYTRNLLSKFYYVPFLRTVSSYGVQFFDSNEFVYDKPEKTSSALLSKISTDPRLRRDVSSLVSTLFGKTIDPRNLPSKTDREKSEVTLDVVKNNFSSALINEGTGLNQVILLLVTLVRAPTNSVIGIEEPEIHLHPKAQAQLSKVMMDIAQKESKQLIFTTHSEHMLYPFLASVASKANNSLTQNDLAIFYVDMDEKEQSSSIESLEVNELGQLKGGLKGFWDADMEIFSEFLGEQDD